MAEESEYQRRQRQAMQRILKAAIPDVQRLMKELVAQTSLQKTIGEMFTSRHERMIHDLINSSVVKRDFRTLNLPTLKLDYKTLFPDFTAVRVDALKSLQPSIKIIQDLQREQFANIIARARAAIIASLPPNWQGEDLSIPEDLESLLLDEGLPLAWVPPHETLVKLFDAASPAERRKILGNRWKSTAIACVAELQGIRNAELDEYVEFAMEAAEGLLEGKQRSSQALSANLLDSVLRASFSKQERITITGQKKRLDIDDYPLRVAIVLGGIWVRTVSSSPTKVTGSRVPSLGMAAPSGVSRRQYSRMNALLALMHLVALLKVIEVDLAP